MPHTAVPPQQAQLGLLREQHLAGKQALQVALLDPGMQPRSVKGVLRALAKHTDGTLRTVWKMANMPASAALIAVGGYGRAELFPGSDIDVLVLLTDGKPPESNPALREAIERFISNCWDVGLEIGSSVRQVHECLSEAANDVTVQTSLLESRWLAGSKMALPALMQSVLAALRPIEFFTAKTLEMRQRHQRFENTPYALEPNCKESPGGLRDLQVIGWVARAAGFGNSWDDMAANGLITDLELGQLKTNEALLSLIRARLHVLSKRREDRLIFDLQTAVAESFGYKGSTTADGQSRSARRASEALMKRYYWAAKAVTQLNQIVLLNIEEALRAREVEAPMAMRAINERFYDRGGLIEVASDDLYLREPRAILETFLLYQSTVSITGLSARTLRALYSARPIMNAKFRNDPANHDTFMAILRHDEGITHALRLMNQTSVLGRYLWVFRNIVGQMQHDLFHVYTVDQHTLMVLRNVRRFFIADHSHEYPFCSQLAAGWDKPWIFFVAAIFHDIAKGRGGDHSALGAKDVKVFCKQHGIEAADSQLIEFIVANHLLMSHVAQKQDTTDPEVVAAFIKRVGNERYLTALYLFTVADIRGTSPKVWNAWKAKLLEDLFKAGMRMLGGHEVKADAIVDARKREALSALALHATPYMAHKTLWDQLDLSYFMRHDSDDIAWHTRHLSKVLAQHTTTENAEQAPGAGAPQPCIVRARRSHISDGLQVMVFAPDQPDLFARICGYFDRAGFSILDARIHNTTAGNALDTFQVTSAHVAERHREYVGMVEAELSALVDKQSPLPQAHMGRLSRRVKSFPMPARVDLRPDDKAQHWLLTISASDRTGLLYGVARTLALHSVSVELSKITTLGERVEDTFLVSGEALSTQKARIALETELLDVLND
jgi:[protein-PII] uridylyltransferase